MGLFGLNANTGIDIGAGSVKIVRIARSGKHSKLISAGIMELPLQLGEEPAKINLQHLLSEKKIDRSNVVTQMPGKNLTIRSFTLPKMPLTELGEAVRWEAKRHISYPLDAALVEYLIVGERQEGTVDKYDIVMVSTERKKVLEHLVPFSEAGITVTAVDANALALRNVFHLLEKSTDVNTVVVDMGAGKTEIDIFKGGALRFSRCLDIGGFDMTKALSEALGTGLQEAEDKKRSINILAAPDSDPAAAAVKTVLNSLLLEIRRSVDYYKTTFREKVVDGTLLTGGVALMQGLKEYFMQSLEGTVELDRPFEELSLKKDLLDEFGPIAPRFSSAIGLALRKV